MHRDMKILVDKNRSFEDTLELYGVHVYVPSNGATKKYMFIPCWFEKCNDGLVAHRLGNLPGELVEAVSGYYDEDVFQENISKYPLTFKEAHNDE